ncbi:MAG TPA: VWA domain-containing protein [Planktothrix sp.]|jgi:uncharacterized protein YegL
MADQSNTTQTNQIKAVDLGILIDTSGTMSEPFANGKNRLEAVEENALAFAREAEKVDQDGILIGRFAGKVRINDNAKADDLKKIFQEYRAMGMTNTKEAVEKASEIMLNKRKADGDKAKSCMLVIFTDGEPDDKVGLAQVIVNITHQIKDRTEFGILFIQVGNDADATRYLQILNNELSGRGADHDIVAVAKLEDMEDQTLQDLIDAAFND